MVAERRPGCLTFEVRGPDGARVLVLPRGRIRIGRTADNEVPLPAASVARRHCEVLLVDGRPALQDNGTTNGTWLRGEHLCLGRPRPLVSGDVIGIPPFEIRVLFDADEPVSAPP